MDVDSNGILDKTIDQYLGSLTTVGNGFYKFTGLENAKYLVEVDPGNFGRAARWRATSQTPTSYDETFGDDHNRTTPWSVTMPTNLYYPKADFGYYSRSCGLSVEKTCVAPAPPSGAFVCSNAKPINSLTMIWNGTQNVRIKAYKGAVGSTLLADIDNIVPGQEVTVNGFAGAPNDVVWEIFNAGTSTKIGASDFHISCSDVDMNGPEDCGKAAGDAKGLTGFINQWIFDGMAGNGQILDCTPAPQPGAEQVRDRAGPARPVATTVGKPTSLTFQYTGGGCAARPTTRRAARPRAPAASTRAARQRQRGRHRLQRGPDHGAARWDIRRQPEQLRRQHVLYAEPGRATRSNWRSTPPARRCWKWGTSSAA